MSTAYDLACPSLKLKIWIGQSNYIYSKREKLDKLARFLHATKGHPLLFVSEHVIDEEIEECVYFEGFDL